MINKTKRKPKEWEKIFPNQTMTPTGINFQNIKIVHTVQYIYIYKKNPKQKWAKLLDRHVSKKTSK